MDDRRIPIGESIAFGWRTAIDNIWSWIVVVLVGALVGWIPVVGALIQAGFIRIALKVYDGEKPEVGDLFSQVSKWLRFFFATILYGLIVLGGLILCIIPGIYWGIKYFFFAYYIVEKDMGIMESLKASGELTYESKFDLFLLWIVLGLINMAGALCFLVGLFVTIPLTLMATVFIYRGLEGDISPAEIERTTQVVIEEQPPGNN